MSLLDRLVEDFERLFDGELVPAPPSVSYLNRPIRATTATPKRTRDSHDGFHEFRETGEIRSYRIPELQRVFIEEAVWLSWSCQDRQQARIIRVKGRLGLA